MRSKNKMERNRKTIIILILKLNKSSRIRTQATVQVAYKMVKIYNKMNSTKTKFINNIQL